MAEKWQLKAVLSASAEGMIKTLNGVSKTARTTRKYLLDVAKSAGNLSGRLGMPVGLLGLGTGALSIAGLKAVVGQFTALSDEIVNTSKGMGVGMQEFQRLKYIGEQSGVGVEALSSSVGRLNKNIAAAVAGKNKDFAALMQRAGISLRDANGQIRSGADLLPELAELFKRNQNAALQARMGNTALGKSWQQLAPLLNEGRSGIDAMTARYKALGFAIRDDAALAGEEFGDRLADLRAVTAGYGNTIVTKLLPTLMPLIERLTQWLVLNKELIATKVADYLAEIARDLAAVDWRGVIDGARSFVKSVKEMVEWVGGAKNALIALVVFMNLPAIMAAVSLGAAFVKLGLFSTGLALKLLAPIAPLQLLQAEMVAANLKGAAMVGMFGKLAAAAGVAFAAWAGWQVGGWLNDNVVNPTVQMLTGDKDTSLGSWLYDKLHPEDAVATRPSLVQGGAQKVGGEIKVSFSNAPPGMRVDQGPRSGPVALNTDVGYRYDAMGMP